MVLLKTFTLASDSQVWTEVTEDLGSAWLSAEVWLDKMQPKCIIFHIYRAA